MENASYNIIGKSPQILELRRIIDQVADTEVAVLIQGESGTGKEMVARAIHFKSSRSGGELVPVNCGAIPEGILESELFGHEKGSFTGASSQRIGYFEMANDGSIFLDEIGEMSLQTQVKLLRVLENGEFHRVGGAKHLRTNARVIAATNKDLELEVSRGNFRQDLFYRLKSITITIPPLRERSNDIALLTQHFIKNLEQKYSINQRGISPEVYERFALYGWPGNVRELRNLLQSLVLLKKGGRIELSDISENIRNASKEVSGLPVFLNKPAEQAERELIYGALLGLRSDITELKNMFIDMLNQLRKQGGYGHADAFRDISEYIPVEEDTHHDISVERIESEAIKEALRRYGGNRRLAANALGISERTLYRKLKKLDND